MKGRPFAIDDLLNLRRPTGMVPLHLSPDGRWLTLTVRPVYEDRSRGPHQPLNVEVRGSRVLVVDTSTGQSREPFARRATSWSAQWSPDGGRLAAHVQHDGPACVGVWERDAADVRLLREAVVQPCYGMEVPQWTPDGRGVVVKLAPEENVACDRGSIGSLKAEAPAVTVFSFDPEARRETPELTGYAASELCADLGYVEVASGKVTRLARGWVLSCWRVAPDGHAVAALRMIGEVGLDLEQYALMILALDGRLPPRQAAPRVLQCLDGSNFNWSPDSRLIAYVSSDDGKADRVFIVPADASAEPRDITAGDSINVAADYIEPPRWSADGKTIYVQAADAIWGFSTTGNERRKFTVGPERKLRFWVQRPMSPTLWPPDGRALFAVVRDLATKNESLVRVDLGSGQASLLTELAQAGIRKEDSEFKREGAPDGSSYYLMLESAHHPPEVWRIPIDKPPSGGLSSLNPQIDDYALGTSCLIEWTAADGQQLQGALLLPPGYEEGQRVPAIVDVYEGRRSHFLNYFGLGDCDHRNGHLFGSRGYALFKPDLPLGPRDPMDRVPGYLLPGIERLVEMGIADAGRIGLMGESYGAYLTMTLLTHTTTFRAAVAISGCVNLTSAYGALTEHGDSFGVAACESGHQCRMGGSLWETREEYIEKSPLFFLDRVRTPVLLVAGTDHWDDPSQAKAAFSALRRLGQQVELRLYRGEGTRLASGRGRTCEIFATGSSIGLTPISNPGRLDREETGVRQVGASCGGCGERGRLGPYRSLC